MANRSEQIVVADRTCSQKKLWISVGYSSMTRCDFHTKLVNAQDYTVWRLVIDGGEQIPDSRIWGDSHIYIYIFGLDSRHDYTQKPDWNFIL